MRTLVIIGDHPRNVGLLNKLILNKKISIDCLILFKRENLIPKPPKNINNKEFIMSRPKIAIIGGGQIGGNLALLAAQKELGDIIIFDIPQSEGMVKGKALDIMQLRPHDGYDADISGTSDWNNVKEADVFIITAGIPRKPGMNREDLLEINLGIMKDVALSLIHI